jgi:hypothetical protein
MNTRRGDGTNRISFLCYELVCVTEERPALRVAQDHPLNANVLELDGAATIDSAHHPQECKPKGYTPDLACKRTRLLEVDVLCCNLDAVIRKLVQWEEVEGRRGDYDLCSGGFSRSAAYTRIW